MAVIVSVLNSKIENVYLDNSSIQITLSIFIFLLFFLLNQLLQ